MKTPGSYESDEKDFIRLNLWDHAFKDLLSHYPIGAIKLLELPGSECRYLKHIEDKFNFDLINCTAIERFQVDHLAIHSYLAGRGKLLPPGNIEDYFSSGHLKKYGPFHIANLDFCGQGFTFPDLGSTTKSGDEYQNRWNCIKYLLEWHRETGLERWHLLLTLSCNRNNPAGTHYLNTKRDELMNLTGSTRDISNWDNWQLIQEVVPMIIADEAIHQQYIPQIEEYESFRYVQQGHKHQMVAWRFGFVLNDSSSLGENHRRHTKELKTFCSEYFKKEGKILVRE